MSRITCIVGNCERPMVARQLCDMHYKEWRRGKRSAGPPKNPKSAKARLIERIDERGPDECWPWVGGMGTWGYGSFFLDGSNINASRAAYILLVGPVETNMVVCHRCDNPVCCNPKHLWVASQADNLKDCRDKGRARTPLNMRGYAGHPRYRSKLTPETVREARKLYFQQCITQTEIARRLGVHSSAISRAVRGEHWAHVL